MKRTTRNLVIFALVAVFSLSVVCFVGLGGGDTAAAATQTVEIYAINDFHGAVDQMPQVAGYLAQRKLVDNAVIVNSGDMFQGSMESNSNYGKLLTDCMDLAGFDAMTLGNHEFDWGLDNLKNLAKNSKTPFLGANIYSWNANTSQFGDFAEDLVKQYVIKELPNGLKVGIIGIIGKDQITSISSQLVQTIGFVDPKEVVPDLSDKLRSELGCDVVIVSAHTGQDTFLDDGSWDITDYADAVLCAHTHRAEDSYRNGVPFIQGGSYGNYVTHVTLTVNNGNVTCSSSGYENISYGRLNNINNDVYDAVQQLIDNSNAAIKDQANQSLATLTGGYLNSATAVPRLVAHAIAEYATSQGYDIVLAMVNNARNRLSGNVTYTQLYEAIPFDNVVYIANVSGKDILNEAKYDSNSIWRVSGVAIQDRADKYYTIAVLDYLLYHQNAYRVYNYFPSAFSSDFTPVALTKKGVEVYNYRLITRDFMLSKGEIDVSVYTQDNIHTDKDALKQVVDLPINRPVPVYVVVLIAVAVVVVAIVIVVVVLSVRKKRAKKQVEEM